MEVGMTLWPRYCVYGGRRCRVLDYVGGNVFRILDADDTVRVLHSSKFIFVT